MDRQTVSPVEEQTRGEMPAEHQALLQGLSVILANERGTASMYQQYTQETGDGELQRQWQRFSDRAQAHAQLTAGAITALHGNPLDRAEGVADVERCIDAMLNITARGSTADLFRLSHLIMAENNSRLYWLGVSRVAPRIKDPSTAKVIRDTAGVIEREQKHHIDWNTSLLEQHVTRSMIQA